MNRCKEWVKYHTLLTTRAYAQGDVMNDIYFVPAVIMLILTLLLCSYIWLKENLPVIAEKGENDHIITVKAGRLVTIKSGGKIVLCLGNTTNNNKKVDKKTGKITDLKPDEKNYLDNLWSWKLFGVVILLWGKSVYEVPLFLFNQDSFDIKNLETQGGIRLDIKVQLMYETIESILPLTLENWKEAAKNQVESAIRGFVSQLPPEEVMKEDVENKDSRLLESVMNINSDLGNKSLRKIVGMEIIRFSVISMDYAEDAKSSMEEEAKAEKQKKAGLKKVELEAEKKIMLADANLKAAQKDADAVEIKSTAEANALKKMTDTIGVKGTTELKKMEAFSSAIENAGISTFVFGTNASLLLENTKKDESGNRGKNKKKKTE